MLETKRTVGGLLLVLAACSSSPTPFAINSDPCVDRVNMPFAEPSMLPLEPGAPQETDRTHEAPIEPGEAFKADCSTAMETLLRSVTFGSRFATHHIEFGASAPSVGGTKDGECSSSSTCWSVRFYDYDAKMGFEGLVDLGSRKVISVSPYAGGIPVSKWEADRSREMGLSHAVIGPLYSRGSGWTPWLYQPSGAETGDCGTSRCVAVRVWDHQRRLLFYVADLHTGDVMIYRLPA